MMIFFRVIALCLLLIANYSWAQTFYWAISLGLKLAEFEELNERSDSYVAKPTLGWQANDYFAIDLVAFLDSASITDGFLGDDGISLTGGQLNLKGILPLSDSWSTYIKVGWFQWESKVRAEAFGSSRSDSGGDIFWGGGISYAISDKTFFYLEYDDYNNLGGIDSHVTSLGFGLRF